MRSQSYSYMCFDSTSFRSLSSLTPPLTINLPNCQTVLITHIGTVSLFSDLILENVFQFSYTLLFTLNHCVLQGLSMRRPQVFGEVSEGLYLLKPKVKESVFNFSKNKVVLPSTVSNSSSVSFPCFSNASFFSLPNCSSTTPN
ncbi:hypothetical protein H5410_048546, partial [Solanum commersonii]